jgi:hypothetical protein
MFVPPFIPHLEANMSTTEELWWQTTAGLELATEPSHTGTTSTDWLVFCRPAVRSTPAIGATSP